MSSATDTDIEQKFSRSAKSPELERLRSRQHSLQPAQTRLGRIALGLQTWLESFVARVSVLPDTPIYDARDFAWVAGVEAGWREIRAEVDAVMKFRDRMPSFHEIIKEVSTITTDESWKTFFLLGTGMDCSDNARRCPQTMRLLTQVPGAVTAFFSILAPGKHIPAHRGAYNGVLRLHLALIVPEPQSACRIRVADQFRSWKEGEALIFDDSFNHEVWNETQGWRVVLFVDLARPLRQPWHWLNRKFIGLGRLAPFLRDAGARQKSWARAFYKD